MGNRKETEQRILDAVGRIIDAKDFDSLGINAVAEEAGVGKVLIYRYFGNFQGLVRRWALEDNYWKEPDQPAGFSALSAVELKDQVHSLLKGLVDKMSRDSRYRKTIRWHLTSGHPVSSEIMRQVEQEGGALMQAFRSRIDSELDLEVLISYLIGGIYYLTLLSDQADYFNQIPLKGQDGIERLKGGADQWIELLFRNIHVKEFDQEDLRDD